MQHLRRLALACLLVTAASVNFARCDTITFSYFVSGNADVDFVFPFVDYSFVPDGVVLTPLGSMDVRYEGLIDFSLLPQWNDDSDLGFWPAGAVQWVGTTVRRFPDVNGASLFTGTSVITGGTGIFASASGFTSYTGSANLFSNTVAFTERIEISAPGLTVVPSLPVSC